MAEYMGSSKPISVTTMKPCCLETIEAYVRTGEDDAEGTVVKCEKYPANSDHRVTVKDGKWLGKAPLKPTPKK